MSPLTPFILLSLTMACQPSHPTGQVVGDDDRDTDTSAEPDREECNGIDDDADGEVDEGYPDDDENGRADCVDLECPALELGEAGAVPIGVEDPWDVTVDYRLGTTPGTAWGSCRQSGTSRTTTVTD